MTSLTQHEKQELEQFATDTIEACYIQAEQTLSKTFKRPTVTFDQRGKIAGSARLSENRLKLNLTLFAENQQEFLQVVIPHEVCHLLVYKLYGRVKPHGIEWKTLMMELYNLPGRATHQMDVTSVSQKTVLYKCDCGPVQLTLRRHNKTFKGTKYFCRRCNSELRLSDI
jgi:SprT protein